MDTTPEQLPVAGEFGYDFSHHNVGVESKFYDMVHDKKRPITFFGLKVSEGISFVDDKFYDRVTKLRHTQGVKALLLYHFFRPGLDPAAQASNFVHQIHKCGPLTGKEIFVVDVEDAPGWSHLNQADSAKAIIRFVQCVKMLLNVHDAQIMVYGSLGWLRGQFGEHLSELTNWKLWAARYGTNLGDVTPWKEWTVWQFNEHAGPDKNFDMNVWNGRVLVPGQLPRK